MDRPEAVRGARLRNRIPIVDRAIRSRHSQALIKAQQRWDVPRNRVRFAATEFFGRLGQISIYEVLDGRTRVAVRHRTRDVGIFDEIFVGHIYQPPPPIATAWRARPPQIVLDLGGNIGLFGAYARALWPSAKITSVEPDPANLLVLERCIAANASSGWTAIAACAAAQAGTVNFSGGKFADSTIALSGDPVTAQVATIDAFTLLDAADFAKIDIEGGEWDLLLDPRLADAHPTVIVLEWHARGCPSNDPFATASKAMHEAGYEVIGDAPDPSYTYGMLWAWRPASLTGADLG